MAFYGAVLAALVQVTCPHCQSVQIRGRRPPQERLSCRACGRAFTQAEGRPRPAWVRDAR